MISIRVKWIITNTIIKIVHNCRGLSLWLVRSLESCAIHPAPGKVRTYECFDGRQYYTLVLYVPPPLHYYCVVAVLIEIEGLAYKYPRLVLMRGLLQLKRDGMGMGMRNGGLPGLNLNTFEFIYTEF